MRRGEYNQEPIEDVDPADPAGDPSAEVERRQRLERLMEAMAQLSPRCRDLFRWKLEGKGFEEIRALLDVDSINTVYTWDFRCRQRLRDLMGGGWE